ncbi:MULTISPECIES: KilA-N domain-containing protein [unclassified Burkholderia]|uniref:KilA-N domain-containing protein n=1 Tax=unclassified Burkholderia TaxID=2613784 RepID=UPI000F5A6FC2|nr:KilA-N domain-containing protein [Burkholderia sp. Bp8995]RQS39246.1 KilA-N domain-containing protein [Burkholderia sp. Bp8989]
MTSTSAWHGASVPAARHFGKRIPHWLENAETQNYMAVLAEALYVRDSGDLIRARRGRDGGTWLHPTLAVAFARWLQTA